MSNYLIVGSGLFGSVLAHELVKRNHSVTVVERRDHIGGNVYTKKINDIDVHVYGAHIFRTNDKNIWDYINQFDNFNYFINEPVAISHGVSYNLPFNLNTFAKIWPEITTPNDAIKKIEEETAPYKDKTTNNLESYVLSKVGKTIYELLIKDYTEKQWGKPCCMLPKSIMNRIPIRFTYNNNYYNCKYQGIPENGYTAIIDTLLQGAEILHGDGRTFTLDNHNQFDKVFYTGCIDEYFNYYLGKLEYRSLKFVHKVLQTDNYQGNAVINYTDKSVDYTRIIEHKWFNSHGQTSTIITEEYPVEFTNDNEPYYPIPSARNLKLYVDYLSTNTNRKLVFCGRLGSYAYTDMEDTIKNVFNLLKREEIL